MPCCRYDCRQSRCEQRRCDTCRGVIATELDTRRCQVPEQPICIVIAISCRPLHSPGAAAVASIDMGAAAHCNSNLARTCAGDTPATPYHGFTGSCLAPEQAPHLVSTGMLSVSCTLGPHAGSTAGPFHGASLAWNRVMLPPPAFT